MNLKNVYAANAAAVCLCTSSISSALAASNACKNSASLMMRDSKPASYWVNTDTQIPW